MNLGPYVCIVQWGKGMACIMHNTEKEEAEQWLASPFPFQRKNANGKPVGAKPTKYILKIVASTEKPNVD